MNNNKSQFFSTREETVGWLDKYKIKNYTINNDLSVDVKGNVDISSENLEIIPIRFGSVTGNFWCSHNQSTSLVGAPESVDGSFWCNDNKLTNLTGAPKTVGGYFDCSDNHLVSIAGSPTTVGGDFLCDDNKLTSLIGAPKIMNGYFSCVNNPLTSLIEIIDCNFKENIYFNIDEKNFKQKELIKILAKYYNNDNNKPKYKPKHYRLTNHQFRAIIKPQIEKDILQDRLNNSKTKIQTKMSFI